MEERSLSSAEACVHCHLCRDNCAFLKKYGIDIGDTERLRELAYHCFLCGKCTEVCPVHIDGRQIVLDLRRERISSGEQQQIEKKYKGLIREKRNYIYRNWKNATSGSVFFPGCNFPSMYPKTTAEIVNLFRMHGIGTVYECCGKPISELGFIEDENRIIGEIRNRLAENGITEIITGCPNCRAFFGDRLGIKVTGIFSKFNELGIGSSIEEDCRFFIPCPDREEKRWIEELRPFIKGRIEIIEGVLCCGLGGSASDEEPEIAASLTWVLKKQSEAMRDPASDREPLVLTYCASCTGRFHRCGFKSIDHVLTRITGTNESPDTRKSYINRIITKFK